VVQPSKKTDSSIGGIPNGHTGIALETVDGGTIDGVVISNIRIDGTECPIFIRLGNRARPYFKGQKIEKPGSLQNISITNVIATNAKKTGCSITGLTGFPVRNISLSHISIEFSGGGTKEDALRKIPEKENAYPEYDMFDVLPSYGFFVRHATGIRFSDIRLTTNAEDVRPALCLNDVQHSDFTGLSMAGSANNQGSIFLENTSGVAISNCRIDGSSSCLLFLKGDQNADVIAANNILVNVKKLYASEKPSKNIVREFGTIK
jgi:polygalacturonase